MEEFHGWFANGRQAFVGCLTFFEGVVAQLHDQLTQGFLVNGVFLGLVRFGFIGFLGLRRLEARDDQGSQNKGRQNGQATREHDVVTFMPKNLSAFERSPPLL